MKEQTKKRKSFSKHLSRGALVLADLFAISVAIVFAYLSTQWYKIISISALIWAIGNIICAIAVYASLGL